MSKANRKTTTDPDAPVLLFRVHFEDGTVVSVRTTTPDLAREKALDIRDGMIRRVKVDRSGTHG